MFGSSEKWAVPLPTHHAIEFIRPSIRPASFQDSALCSFYNSMLAGWLFAAVCLDLFFFVLFTRGVQLVDVAIRCGLFFLLSSFFALVAQSFILPACVRDRGMNFCATFIELIMTAVRNFKLPS